jgi:hypothetical protein
MDADVRYVRVLHRFAYIEMSRILRNRQPATRLAIIAQDHAS